MRRGLSGRSCLAWLTVLLPGLAAGADLEFDEYLQRASAGRSRGDWESAASQYAQALNHADLPGDSETRAKVNLEYGRSAGVLCQFEEAEKFLLRARDISAKATQSTFRPLYELGALNLARKRYMAAESYFTQMAREPVDKQPPWLVADALEKFAETLLAAGRNADADTRRREAGRIRDQRPPRPPAGTVTPYGAQCEPSLPGTALAK